MGCCTSIEQSSVGIVESCGKFERTATSGFVFLNPFMCESLSGKVSLRIQQLNVTVETKSKDNVFVHIIVSVQYQVIWEKVFDAHYKLMNPREQITAYIFDVVRAEVPKISLDDLFITKDNIADAVRQELSKVMAEFGFEILKTLITDINPNQKVKAAMNDINAAERLKHAAKDKAEAQKIGVVKSAEAESESKYLSGVGIAKQRTAIIDGLRDSVVNFSKHIDGASPQDVMDLVLITQYFDMMKEIGLKNGGSTLFLEHSPGSVSSIADQIRQGFSALSGNSLSTHGSGDNATRSVNLISLDASNGKEKESDDDYDDDDDEEEEETKKSV